MKVLYVTASCLNKNTSANMSHNAFVKGLLENGCEVDILMAQDSWGQQDSKLPTWENVQYFCYPATAFKDKLRFWMRKLLPASETGNLVSNPNSANKVIPAQKNIKMKLRSEMKRAFYHIFPNDPCYPLDRTWLKNASHFRSKVEYDLVISNSSPAASHRLVMLLMQAKHLFSKRWIQVWEDPWYADLYGNKDQIIFREEHNLLTAAAEVYYVSPLTMEYQRKLFPDCAHKMKHIPLPYLDFSEEEQVSNSRSFGYFGDYFSHTRNLLPFYEALHESGLEGSIYGDSDLALESTKQITVRGRVTLDVLTKIQSKTGILVHLCNLKGGQIPGKIYHYSATNKPILFILDGTDEEQQRLKEYFGQFNRYYFTKNQKECIYEAIIELSQNYEFHTGKSIPAFDPKNVVKDLL